MAYLFFAFFILVLFFFSAGNANAYIDPGSGSLIIQVIIGALLGGLLTMKIYFNKIKNYIFKKKTTQIQKKVPEKQSKQ